MSISTINDQRAGVELRCHRIARFLRGQDHLQHVLAAWHGGREVVFQALPNPETALEILSESLQRDELAPAFERTQTSPARAYFSRLDSQIRACIRGLQRAGVEFVLCWKIENQDVRLEYDVHSLRRTVGLDLLSLLERAQRYIRG